MDVWVVGAIVIILVSIFYSAWKRNSFSIIASVACVAVFILSVVAYQLGDKGVADELAFAPHDIAEPAQLYTILTSMFMHASITHLFVNLVTLVLIGLVFEQRIGTRPFIVLYMLAGVAGTLAFAAVRWNEPSLVVGASGAITGILGGFARMYPNERMIFFPIPIPLSIWTVVLLFVLLQAFLLYGEFGIAAEAHLGGLVAGVLLAPYVVRLPLGEKKTGGRIRSFSVDRLRGLATTPQLRAILDRIEHEEVPEVRNAWVENFLSKARCPQCGSRLLTEKELIVCEKGHII